MDQEKILTLSALELGQAIKNKETTSVEVTKAFLDAIGELDG